MLSTLEKTTRRPVKEFQKKRRISLRRFFVSLSEETCNKYISNLKEKFSKEEQDLKKYTLEEEEKKKKELIKIIKVIYHVF